MDKSILKRETEGGEHRGGGLEKQRVHGQITKAARKPNTSEGVFIPAGLVRPVRWTGQTGWLDWSDRCQGLVRPVGLQHPLYNDLVRRPRFFLRNEVFSAMLPS